MTKVIQEVQHPQYGLLQKFNIKTKNGNDMVTIGYVDSKNLLLRAPGYIITRDGECIIIPEQIKHADFFTNFLAIYNEKTKASERTNYDTFSGAIELAREGFLVYIGIREEDIFYNGLQDDIGFFVPDNITPSQLIAHNNLIDGTDGLDLVAKFNDICFNYIDTKGNNQDKKPAEVAKNVLSK